MQEEKILYFDIISGISGDMTLATLLNLGVPKEIFLKELDKLNLSEILSSALRTGFLTRL